MPGPIYTPSQSNALGPSYTGHPVQDSVTYINYDAAIATAAHVPYEVQNELKNLIQIAYAAGGAIEVFNNSALDMQPGPVTISGHYGIDAVSGNPIFYVIGADASQETPANAILRTALVKNTQGNAFFGGNYLGGVDTRPYSIGVAAYVAKNGGIQFTEPDREEVRFIQIVGYIQTLAVNGIISGIIQPSEMLVAPIEEESAFV